MTEEATLLRFDRGPLHGVTLTGAGWPPPDKISVEGQAGMYEKVSQSQLPEPVPGVMRGAQYRWVDR